MSADAKQWNLLLDQFHDLAREDADSIEDIFDTQFRLRFSELIDQAVHADWQRWGDSKQ